MKEWFSIPQLEAEALPDLPGSARGIRKLADRQGWDASADLSRVGEGGVREYHLRLLPSAARQRLAVKYTTFSPGSADKERSKMLWKRFERLTEAQRDTCRFRLQVLVDAETMRQAGIPGQMILSEIKRRHGVGKSALYEWRALVGGIAREDWLPALAPANVNFANGVVVEVAECHPMAWQYLCSDFLRAGEPKFSACYRRMKEEAAKNGWEPIPSERTLRRRMDAEFEPAVQVLAREGREAARRMYPAQRRDKTKLHAMEMVNTDGHVLDLRIHAPWSKDPVRITLLGIQDVYSAKILSWRLCEAETWEAVRSAIGDMVENHGIPQHIFMDNGKAFASKKISGGTKSRNRFKVRDDEIGGLLTALGVEIHFTTPYRGQAKPIERAWKDLAQEIALHPSMDGAYTGSNPQAKPHNYGSRAVPLDEVYALVANRIAEHNARVGRSSRVAAGRSFDDAFAESYAANSHLIRSPTSEQRSLWLMAVDQRTARKPDGHIEYQGNRYWSQALQKWIGKKVTFRFDPDRLHDPLKVYDAQGRLICDAGCIQDAGFASMADARAHAKSEKEYLAATRAFLSARQLLNPQTLGRVTLDQQPKAPEPPRAVVRRIATSSAARKVETDTEVMSQDEFNARFSAGMSRVTANVVSFPNGGKR